MSDFSIWVYTQAAERGLEKPAEVARALGIQQSVVNRWEEAKQPPTYQSMRVVSQKFKIPMSQVLVAAGYMTEDEAKLTTVEVTRRLSDAELVHEIGERLGVVKPRRLKSVDQVSDVDDDAPPPLHLADAARREPGYVKSGDREPDE